MAGESERRRHGPLQDVTCSKLVWVGWFACQLVQETIPGFAVSIPSAEILDAEQRCFAESALERRVVGDLLHSFG